jgi:hypothetical protein
MLHRMWGMLKVAGEPLPYYGSSGVNVTSQKSLSPERRGGLLSIIVTVLGMIQSVARYALLPLATVGLWLAVRRNLRLSALLFVTMFYYLVPGTFAHTEIRYVLPVHYLLPIFAGLTIVAAAEYFSRWRDRRSC